MDSRKMDAVVAHCDALTKRFDALSKRRSDAQARRSDAAGRTFTKSQLAASETAVEKAKEALASTVSPMQRKARQKELTEAEDWLKKVKGSTITDSGRARKDAYEKVHKLKIHRGYDIHQREENGPIAITRRGTEVGPTPKTFEEAVELINERIMGKGEW